MPSNKSDGEFVLFEGGIGFSNAETILLAISPSVVLAYGPSGSADMPIEIELTGEDAESFAEEHNELIIAQAIDWVAASPDHVEFTSMDMPAPSPLLTVRDYGSSAAARVNSTPARRPMRRVRPDDVLEQVLSE
ncbi:hypothetical protein [Arthrobacter sp. ERGS1:01]|uniref:hypothetical protein n=1 Tax=Arthrobacter sp. ERGS1:01 TaxID=1704044 RepID=UPI000B308528|nr:hypothetical protein [Arthrobacter sp. ERGS1:01]